MGTPERWGCGVCCGSHVAGKTKDKSEVFGESVRMVDLPLTLLENLAEEQVKEPGVQFWTRGGGGKRPGRQAPEGWRGCLAVEAAVGLAI